MGCASSKRIEVTTVDAYRPAPTSFAVFDINAIEEPWLKHLNTNTTTTTTTVLEDHQDEKLARTHVPAPILQKLNMLESTEAPQSWDEVSKALQDLKPIVVKPPSTSPAAPPKPTPLPPRKSASFHTVEELDAELLTSKSNPKPELKKPADKRRNEPAPAPPPVPKLIDEEEKGGFRIKPVKENIFILRDRLERQKEEKESNYARLKSDPLSQFPEKCPPGGSDAVVIYTTSLGGVRKTFEACNRARDVLEGHRVVFDERDVSLHGEFLKELKELLGEGEGGTVALPRVFVKGRYVGGLEELVQLNESGRLGRILNAMRVERGVGRQGCGGCGGARFVPCLDCGGSCKVVVSSESGVNKERCPKCNENGLVHCPACL